MAWSLQSIEVHKGDVTDAPSLARALDGIDSVIHLVGIISEAGNRTFERIHIQGTRNMVELPGTKGSPVRAHERTWDPTERRVSVSPNEWASRRNCAE